ncbi:hypothetical protein Q6348_08435 [Isoptericola sp. b441]|uniref:Uncharacterized protein n=1 Tax=Actinotalea lenta TaxID=3064654 RepID=A0ABT9D8K6_9CELL|nr:hypothetical protein [Isoptericola sp. b441]MDO8107220.1 hypothetical protein [Isoptericola sp. b441]
MTTEPESLSPALSEVKNRDVRDAAKAPKPLSMVLVMPDGTSHTEVLPGPGGKIRVAVGSPGKRASLWTIIASKGKGDVYMTARGLGSGMKFSLHESGEWRFAFLSDDLAEQHTGSRRRLVDQWDRPEGSSGWARAVEIRTLHGHLADVDDAIAPEEVTWLPEAQPGRFAVMHVAVVKPNEGVLNARAVPVAGLGLGTGEAVVVLYSTHEFTEAHRANLAENLRRYPFPASAADAVAAAAASGQARLAVEGSDDASGVRVVWDLRVTSPSGDDAGTQ